MRNANPLKAGLFIVISFAVAAGVFFGITGTAVLSGSFRNYSAVFDLHEDVAGLNVGSDVRIGGFIVGSVRSVEVVDLDSDRPKIRVGFRVPEQYPIRQDATVVVQAGITGLVNLNLTQLGSPASALATADQPLDGQPSGLAVAMTSFADIGGQVSQTLSDWRPRGNAAIDQIRTTAASADQTIQQVRSKIDPAYDKYAAVADSTRGAMASADSILGDTKGDIRKTLANLSGLTTAANEKVPTLLDELTATVRDVRKIVDRTGRVLQDVQAIATDGREVASSARTIVTGNRGRIDEIVKRLNVAGDNLAAASSEIRRSPWRLLYKPSEGEVANQNLFDATRQFAEASRKLQDSSMALRDSLADPKIDQAQIQSLLDQLNSDFANYQKVESALWERVR